MNRFLMIGFLTTFGFEAMGSCNLRGPNDILSLIKKNHPNFSLNIVKGNALEKAIDVAGQSPNPEFDVETSIGDSLEGNVYTTSASLKHTFELGGKRSSRINVAKKTVATSLSIARHENQDALVDVVLKLYRLRQVYELIPLYEESLDAFGKILRAIRRRKSLSPEQQVENETLGLASNDYKLKIAQLNSEKVNLSKQLTYYMGTNCIIPRSALPYNVNLSEKFKPSLQTGDYAKLNAAEYLTELAKANLELEKSYSYPDLQVGPTYEFEKINIRQNNTIGISLTMDLPIFNTNRAGRAKAAKELLAANLNLKNIKNESELDLQAWVSRYNQYRDSLKTIANRNDLERKHRKIEALFKRGIISTSLVIESHRQLIEFSNTRFEFEKSATEALWNIYKMNGTIDHKSI